MEPKPYQYQVDIEGLAGEPDPSWVEVEGHDGGSPLGIHDTTLFDQNESESGELIDTATGEPINNSKDVVGEEIVTVEDVEELYGPDDPESDPEYYFLVAARRERVRRALIRRKR